MGGGQAGSAEQGSVADIEGLAGPARAEAMLKRAYGEELFDRDATAFLEVRGARARARVCVCVLRVDESVARCGAVCGGEARASSRASPSSRFFVRARVAGVVGGERARHAFVAPSLACTFRATQEGTRENPIPILSIEDSRVVGVSLPDDATVRWFTLKAGELTYDPNTCNWFALKKVSKSEVDEWVNRAEKQVMGN